MIASPVATAPTAPPVPSGVRNLGPPVGAVAPTRELPLAPSTPTPVRPPGLGDPLPTAAHSTAVPRPRWGWRALLAFVTGGALTAAGFGVAQISNGDAGPGIVQTSETLVTTTAGGANSIVVQPPDLDTTEPVAFVAALLGPSVVQIETDIGLGSGVIYDDGLILTNHHVIENSSQVRVRLSDGRTLDATVVGSDPRTDIAVISAGVGLNLPVATLALEDELVVGELTVAIGSPFQLQQTVTSGIVSAVNRPIFNGTGWNAVVQTDAAINPGNSGGALANRAGEVIGLNTAIQTDGVSQSSAGIGFAMPIVTAFDVATRIVAGESLEPGFLGVQGTVPTNGEIGVEIAEVTAGSAADFAGLLVGDIVFSINGAPVTIFQELAGLVQTSFPGEEIDLELRRNGELLTVRVVLGER